MFEKHKRTQIHKKVAQNTLQHITIALNNKT